MTLTLTIPQPPEVVPPDSRASPLLRAIRMMQVGDEPYRVAPDVKRQVAGQIVWREGKRMNAVFVVRNTPDGILVWRVG